jgi:hypothetical protein
VTCPSDPSVAFRCCTAILPIPMYLRNTYSKSPCLVNSKTAVVFPNANTPRPLCRLVFLRRLLCVSSYPDL